MEYETFSEKFVRKFKKNPMVPIGSIATAGILFGGFHKFLKGNSASSNKFMQARIIAQGITLSFLVGGMAYSNTFGKEEEEDTN